MASSTPTVRQVNWLSLIPQLAFMFLLGFLWHFYDKKNYIIYSTLTYLIISIILRAVFASDHRKGMLEVRNKNFKDAIPHFKNSYEHFTKNNILDKWRFLLLLSSSAISYKEMALVNIAFCYSQIAEGELAKEYYEKALEEFPDSGMAKAGLNMLEALR